MRNTFFKIITVAYVIIGVVFLFHGAWAIILFLVPSWLAWIWILDPSSESPEPDKYNRSNDNLS